MHSLFVGDITHECGELELSQLFGRFGAIVDIRLKRASNTLRQPYATISFATLPAAEAARSKLDGFMFMGRKLKVRWASQNSRQSSGTVNSVYVRYLTNKRASITEMDLRNIFSSFGIVKEASIKESTGQSGYGFVHFSSELEGVRAAIQCVSKLDNATVDGITFFVELSRNLLKQFSEADLASVAVPPTLPQRASRPERQRIPPVRSNSSNGSLVGSLFSISESSPLTSSASSSPENSRSSTPTFYGDFLHFQGNPPPRSSPQPVGTPLASATPAMGSDGPRGRRREEVDLPFQSVEDVLADSWSKALDVNSLLGGLNWNHCPLPQAPSFDRQAYAIPQPRQNLGDPQHFSFHSSVRSQPYL